MIERAPVLAGSRALTLAAINPTASATVNTKGAWSQITASLAFDTVWALLSLINTSGTARMALLDLGIGAAGDEQIVLENLHYAQVAIRTMGRWLMSLGIPAGSRLAVRSQSSLASDNQHYLGLTFLAGHLSGLSRYATFGADVSDSGGQVVDPGAVADTYNAWAQLSASTPFDLRHLFVIIGGRNNTVLTSGSYFLRIGIGAVGDEQVIVDELAFGLSAISDNFTPSLVGPIPVCIPAGSRLAVGARSSVTDATDRLADVVLYGGAA